MPNNYPQIKIQIEQNIKDFSSKNLFDASIALLETLGYTSGRKIKISPNTPENFVCQFDPQNKLSLEKALIKEWRSIDFLFQLTAEEIKNASQIDLGLGGSKIDDTIIESYLFFAITLKNSNYTRTQISQITREINKLFPMPAMLLFKSGGTDILAGGTDIPVCQRTDILVCQRTDILVCQQLTFSIINRRLHKRDTSKDVLEKVTLIKDINIASPHRAHIEILFDLSLPQLTAKHPITNFVELHNAWQKTLDTKLLSKRFYQEIANWYFCAMDKVSFPDDIEKNKETRNAVNLIRLITRLIFIWFIKEKNIVPESLFNETNIQQVVKEFNKNENANNYYTAILQNLFFGTLNQKMNERRFVKDGDFIQNKTEYGIKNLFRYADKFSVSENEALQLFQNIPFLNGGLFDCLDKPDDEGKILYVDGFSRNEKKQSFVPDFLFFADEIECDYLNEIYGTRNKRYKTKGLIKILSNYKFTVTENTPVEEEIALDPELLGKVFENLLASYNPETQTTARKQTGSFYTPREIVNYMVDESLNAYLKQKSVGQAFLPVNNGQASAIQPPPPVGQAFLPVNSRRCQTRMSDLLILKITNRHLPHWQLDNACYFITFKTKNMLQLSCNEQKIVHDHIVDGNNKFYYLLCSVTMPDHVHIILKLNKEYDLSRVMKGIKGVSANKINKVNNETKSVWQDESFDRIVRDENELDEKINYMFNNPIKKGLTDNTFDYFGWFLNDAPPVGQAFLPVNNNNNQRCQTRMSDLPQIESKICDIISYSENPNPFNEEETNILIEAIDSCKILDPACGSGAFPMGILHKMVHILHKLDPRNELWKQKQIDKASQIDDPAIRDKTILDIEEAFDNNELDYGRKLYLIENCIFGIDIQPIAVQIAKLRFFISLVVDQKKQADKENFGIRSLPNLETKFVAANTLIGLEKPKQIALHNPEIDNLEEKLKTLRHQYFSAKTRKKKLACQKKDKDLRKKIADMLVEDGWEKISAKQVADFDPYDQNASADFFDPEWMFGLKDGFDIVIGNPPYVQLQKDSGKLANMFKNCNYKTFERTGDIYTLFYENGINNLNAGGHLCFITSNKWMRAGYGKSLRKFFTTQTPKLLIDLGPGIFENTTVDTNILVVGKSVRTIGTTAVTIAKQTDDVIDIEKQVKQNAVQLTNLSDDAWFIGSSAEQNLKEKIEQIGKPLKDWDVKIYRGVVTGLNEAFIIDTATRDRLVAEDPNSAKILKPILRGRDIKRYGYEWAGLWLIFIPWHFPLHKDESIQGASSRAEKEFEKQYPAIFKHLLHFKDLLSKRNKDETGIRYEWYALQRCAATYYHEFEKEKVVWSDIATEPLFSLLPKDIFFNNTVYMIVGAYNRLLVGILNSNIIKWYFPMVATDLGGKGCRFFKIFVEIMPIPPITTTNRPLVEKIESLADEILAARAADSGISTANHEHQINQLVYQLYKLTDDEIAIVEGKQ